MSFACEASRVSNYECDSTVWVHFGARVHEFTRVLSSELELKDRSYLYPLHILESIY